jgi:hypothetical protein
MRDIVSKLTAEHEENVSALAEKVAVIDQLQFENKGLQLSLADNRHQLQSCTAAVKRSFLLREHVAYRWDSAEHSCI